MVSPHSELDWSGQVGQGQRRVPAQLSSLEMLPVLRLFWLGLEVDTKCSDLVGEEVTPTPGNIIISKNREIVSNKTG